ncbi:MAG: folate family ECF transporter S component [Clostridia bacterium]|nr:folate family ECF transporter S component [Clostridia bacterium]
MQKNSHQRVVSIVICGLLIALGVILMGPLSLPALPFGTYSLNIGFGSLPIILSGVLFGPVYGAIVAMLTDLLQVLLFPKGAFMPWFTLSAMFFGLIPGLFFMKRRKVTFPYLLLAITPGQLLSSVLLNTFLLVKLYGLPWSLMTLRLMEQAIMIPLYAVLIYAIIKLLARNKVLDKFNLM